MDTESNPVLVRLETSKDFPLVEALVAHLRRRSPGTVNTLEISNALGCRKGRVYGLIKLARRWLALTTGEFIPNLRSVGYRLTSQPRAALFESIKSGNRADGHLAQEMITFNRVKREHLESIEDVELFLHQQTRIVFGAARLDGSKRIEAVLRRREANLALAGAAGADAKTPWKELGFDNHDDDGTN